MSKEDARSNVRGNVNSPLAFLEKRIERAREGDTTAALSLLRALRVLLDRDQPIPAPLRAYLSQCITKIESTKKPGREVGRAFNLVGRRGSRQSIARSFRDDLIVVDVGEKLGEETARSDAETLRGEGSPLTRAIGAVADKHDLSERQIYRIVSRYLSEQEGR